MRLLEGLSSTEILFGVVGKEGTDCLLLGVEELVKGVEVDEMKVFVGDGMRVRGKVPEIIIKNLKSRASAPLWLSGCTCVVDCIS